MPAIFIGRFQPFHKGHLKAIKWILKKEKEIFIIIGSSQQSFTKNNPFSFSERKKMIKNALIEEGIGHFKIYGMTDLIKSDILWAKQLLKRIKHKPEEIIIFTKNPWTKKSFQKIGVKVRSHPMFFNELSATQIRKKIAKDQNWRNLVPEMVSNFLREIKGKERIKSIFSQFKS